MPSGAVQHRPTRILYFTHSAGYRHDVIPASWDVLQRIGSLGGFEITASEDIAVFSTENLRRYGAVMFFTTGELPLSNAEQAAFLDFIGTSGGFLGVHSATDTSYPVARISKCYWRLFRPASLASDRRRHRGRA